MYDKIQEMEIDKEIKVWIRKSMFYCRIHVVHTLNWASVLKVL